MKQETQYLTQEKFDELTIELDQLKTVSRREIAEELEYSKSLGDLSENAEYHQARESQMNLEERIQKLEMLLKHAVILSGDEKVDTDTVSIGNTVSLLRTSDSATIVYSIVGSEEADITQNKLSVAAPIASAMLGKKKGESFSVRTPKGEVVYKIVTIG